MYKAVLFDLDDTLVTTYDALPKALRAARLLCCEAAGAAEADYDSFNRAVVHRMFAEVEAGKLTWQEARYRIHFETLELMGHTDPDLAARVERQFSEVQLQELRLCDDAAVLEQLHGKVRMGLITNGSADDHPGSQLAKVARCGLERYLDPILISDQVGCCKPDPAIFRAALDRLGLAPEQVLFVGDHLRLDVAGANAAGIPSVWINRSGAEPPEFPEGGRPAFTVRSLLELPAILGL